MDSSFQRGPAGPGLHGRAGKAPKSKVSHGKKEPLSGEKSRKAGRAAEEERDPLALGAALATLRLRKGLNKSELGRKARIKPKLLSGYEQGTTTPRPQMLERIAEALDSSVEEIDALAELHSTASRTEGAAAAARAARLSTLLIRAAEAMLGPEAPAPRASRDPEEARTLRERLRPYSLAEQRAIVLEDESFHRGDLSLLLRSEGMEELADLITVLTKAG